MLFAGVDHVAHDTRPLVLPERCIVLQTNHQIDDVTACNRIRSQAAIQQIRHNSLVAFMDLARGAAHLADLQPLPLGESRRSRLHIAGRFVQHPAELTNFLVR